MEKIIGTVPGKCRKKREKARLTLNNNPEISWHMKKSRRTYNGVHLNKKSNTQDVVEQSLTIIRRVMNIEEAKRIPLEDYLRRMGFSPVREQGDSLWYRSPFRQERTPSFKVSLSRNL